MVSVNEAAGQTIRINELASTNVSFLDEDGDTPDWFELYNSGAETINLNGWSISDKVDDSLKWRFPDVDLAPDQHLLLWASGKDRKLIGYPRTFVAPGDEVHYLIPTSEPDASWRQVNFDDSNWMNSTTGIGYGDNDDATIVPNGTVVVFLRKEFQLSNKAALAELILDIDFDDAFVAYINGVEVARSGISNSPPAYNQTASIGHEANLYRGIPMERFTIANPQSLLVDGTNVLSIQAHNISSNSSDMTIIPALSGLFISPQTDGITPPEILNLRDQYLHTNFKISSEGETLYLYDNQLTLIDSLKSADLSGERTVGKIDNSGVAYFFTSPTPGAANTSIPYSGMVNSVLQFSNDGGVNNPLSLTITGNNVDEEIRFTTDGKQPDINSQRYTGAIQINQTTTLKASIFRPSFLPSPVETRTYIIGSPHELPIVSLTFDHDDFFDPVDGMYVLGEGYNGDIPYFGSNIWEEWERPVNFEFYEADGRLGISLPMGAKIFGGWTRANSQRSLSLFARSGYGRSSLDYSLFKNVDYDSFQAIVLRNSGNDWLNTQIRDAMMTSLMKGSNIEYQLFRPVATYFNGEYWGFYNIREKINEHFVATKAGLDPDDIDLLEIGGDVVHGSNIDYMNLLAYLQSNSLSNEANYAYVKSKIDIDNYLSYLAAQIYFGNTDWPGNNVKFWTHPNGKWRWILYDTDFGFSPWDNNGHYHNTLDFALEANGPGWPNPPWSTFLSRRLVESEEFRHDLINRFADFLNSRFKEENVLAHIDSIRQVIEPEMARHMARWGGNINAWPGNVERMKNFGRNRPSILRSHIMNRFGLDRTVNVSLENPAPSFGLIQLNSLTIDVANWTGKYFGDVPIEIKAIAREGYRFSHWSGSVDSANPELNLTLSVSIELKANFEPLPELQEPIIINEINYNSESSMPAGDWIEIYNPNRDAVYVSDWQFKDANDLHIFRFPRLQNIPANGYLVISRNLTAFNEVYPTVENVIGGFDFGLSSDNDLVRIFNSQGELQDEVSYSSTPPWPTSPNGTGATLELLSPELDNSLPESWGSVNIYGSPGRRNALPTGILENPQEAINLFPNPVTDILNIVSANPLNHIGQVQVIDFLGKVKLEARLSTTSKTVDLTSLPSGPYVVRIIGKNGLVSRHKIIKQ